jgi:uncharacterized protein DUF6441
MRLSVQLLHDPSKIMLDEYERGERAVTYAMRGAARDLKEDWKRQIQGAGLGRRLSNTIKNAVYPGGTVSMNAAAMVWTKAPDIIRAHEHGEVIRSADGFYLAIPTEAAGRGGRRGKMTPGLWESLNSMRLRFVYRRTGPSFLVADDARLNKRGQAKRKGGRRRKSDGILSGAQTVPIFILVPSVKLRKRTNLKASSARIAAGLPGRINANWKGR